MNKRDTFAMRLCAVCSAATAAISVLAAPDPVSPPALMRTFAGADVRTREDWENVRAPELLAKFEQEEYGRRPSAANERARVSFETYDTGEALGGKAVRKLVRATYKGPNGTFSFPFTAYIPKAAKPVPAFVLAANIPRSELDGKQGLSSEFWPVEAIVGRGFATAAFRFDFVAADRKGAGFSQGVFPSVQPEDGRDDESWATISAWAWADSRLLDWMETEPLIDATRVAVVGHSRGGKTAIWAGVTDRRFAMVCSNNSGCSGAKLNHIDLPRSEHIAQILKNFPYWFCGNYRRHAGGEMSMAFDQHELLALVAPRLLCVASATEDHWAGQRGEWWAAKLASPAWELYGKKGLVAETFPKPEMPQQEGCISYHLRTGKHFLAPYDWDRYMDFAERHGWTADGGEKKAGGDSPKTVKPIPATLFGQNIEHTRSALQGGLSAQLVKNRKFAGKPSRIGVAMMWEPYGSKAYYHQAEGLSCTRHAKRSRMFRKNERASQVIGCLDADGEAGIRQGGIGIRGGVAHNFRAVVSTLHPVDTPFVLRVAADGKILAERAFTVNTKGRGDWTRIAFDFTAEKDVTAEISVGVKGRRCGIVGAVSVMPADNFRGMRADVIENLRDIGTSIVRWPGGNFAGEYRWRDGLIADPDERAPLQSYTEIETQPHGLGYDQNDIGMEDILALCERIGAEPFFTINATWEEPQDSADWVKACRGRVKLWSLGNEMGYGHMEGPKGPKGYTDMVRPHAEAMLKVDPTLKITASGLYPGGGDDWIENSAKALKDVAPVISYHRYDCWDGCLYDYTTPETTENLFATVSKRVDAALDGLTAFRARVPREIGISYDEWNLWYMWYRKEAIVEGLYAAKMLTGLMRNWEDVGLTYVCYFQAINEQAICVSPFESHLTSLGEAMCLWKGHVGGVPASMADAQERVPPENAFVTDHPDGSRYATFYNFSTVNPCTFRIPADGRGKIVAEEMLVPDGLESGCRFGRKSGTGKVAGGFYELTLAPASLSCVRLAK